MKLTEAKCRAIKATGKIQKVSDGSGLYLMVSATGTKLWRHGFRRAGKQHTLSYGNYPKVALADARQMRDATIEVLDSGLDPTTPRAEAEPETTFKSVADRWLTNMGEVWSAGHTLRIASRIKSDLYPAFGATKVSEITPQVVLEAVRSIEDRGAHDVAKRVLQSTVSIFNFAKSEGLVANNPADGLTRALKPGKPQVHRAAIKFADLPEFMQKLRAYDGDVLTRLALEVVVHTFVRTNEIRFGNWSEIDGNTWRIPAARMKMGKDLIVPLTPHVQDLFAQMRAIPGGDPDRIAPMSENTLIFAMYRMGYHSRATVHGFRSLASTHLNESGLWGSDAIERQLAHVPANQVRSAYNAALYLPERRAMMEWWSDQILTQCKVEQSNK